MGPFARYALALSSWKEGVDGAIQLEEARASVTRALGAMWALRGVGAYLIFVGDEACWRPQMDSMRPDMTGLHHTIIQGVHFLDPASGARSFHQAAWGPVRFGGIQSVAALVELLTFPLAEDAFDDPPPREG